MAAREITDTFHVIDETGNRYRVREITQFEVDSSKDAPDRRVHYELDDGRRLTAFLGSRQFRDDDSGAFYDRT